MGTASHATKTITCGVFLDQAKNNLERRKKFAVSSSMFSEAYCRETTGEDKAQLHFYFSSSVPENSGAYLSNMTPSTGTGVIKDLKA